MTRLKDRVCIITGGTSGIGRACVERFAAEGAKVVLSGRRKDAGDAIAKALGAIFIAADVMREEDIRGLVAGTLERFDHIDCVISNAGMGSKTRELARTESADFDRDLALHVRAPFLAMKYASPAMTARGAGSFINMSSISALSAGLNAFGYEVAKAALTHLTRCAALELGEKGVRVNSISPGPTLTPIFTRAIGGTDDTNESLAGTEAIFSKLLPGVQAMPGMIRAHDIAAAALFLASDEARYINGHDLIVDGGITAGRPARVMRAGQKDLREALARKA